MKNRDELKKEIKAFMLNKCTYTGEYIDQYLECVVDFVMKDREKTIDEYNKVLMAISVSDSSFSLLNDVEEDIYSKDDGKELKGEI